jgi:hypothetical protein
MWWFNTNIFDIKVISLKCVSCLKATKKIFVQWEEYRQKNQHAFLDLFFCLYTSIFFFLSGVGLALPLLVRPLSLESSPQSWLLPSCQGEEFSWAPWVRFLALTEVIWCLRPTMVVNIVILCFYYDVGVFKFLYIIRVKIFLGKGVPCWLGITFLFFPP